MGRTLTTSRLTVCFCALFLCWALFQFDGAQAAADSNSTSEVSADGGDGKTGVEKGMEPFYNMVKSFLGVVQPNKLSEQSWLNLTQIFRGDFQKEQLSDWKNWIKYLVGFVVCAAIGLLFFVVMPITGLIFCCCRCCGKCGGRPKPQDPKHAGCKRNTYCTLLLVLNTVALAGVVCAFLFNQILYDKLRNENNVGPTGKIVQSADLINGFANSTFDEIEVAVFQRFVDASVDIIATIRDSAQEAVDNVLNTLNAIPLLDQSKMVASDVTKAQDELNNVADKLRFLSTQGVLLSDNLTEIRADIDTVCNPASSCPGYDPTKYTLSANFSGLDTLSSEASNVAKSLNLSQYITQAENTINSSKSNATENVENSINDATSSIESVKQSARDAVREFKEDIQVEITTKVDEFRAGIIDAQDDITKFSKYVWYGGIAVSCALLLVVVLYYIGILFGLCGERPGFGAQCCNTGTGANFLMAGVGITFILAWLIMLVCTILFVIGGPIYTEMCRYFEDHHPQDLKPFNDALMNAVDFQKNLFGGKDVKLDLVEILKECENNEAIYSVLRLENMVNITQYTNLTEVRKALDDFKQTSFNIPDITILTSEMNQSITDFADAGLKDIQFDEYFTEIDKNLTEGDLPALATQLRTIASQSGVPPNTKSTLETAANRLNGLQTDLVVPMQQAEDSLKASLTGLQRQAQGEIKNSTDALLNGLQTAENKFNTQKDSLIKTEVVKVIDDVTTRVDNVVQDIVTDVNNNIGKCRPVFDSFYSTSDAACVVALEPLNGLWFSIGWSLFFFVPALIFAVKLAGLYRREHEDRDFDDPNFSLYEDAKQDDIPLTSRQQSGHAAARQGRGMGVANNGYQEDSYMGPSDYPNYKGDAGYQRDGYMRSSPPPYGAYTPSGRGAMNGNPRDRDHRMYPY